MLNIQQVARLRRAVDPVPEIEGFDPTTGLAARKLFVSRIEKQWESYGRNQQAMCLLLINCDRFQEITQGYAQDVIDAAMAAIAKVISDVCQRRADFAGLIRDGEFGVYLADCDAEGAYSLAQELRTQINQLDMRTGPDDRLTVSIGGACRVPTPSRFANSLMIAADQALDQAKEQGGDQVVFCDAP